MDELLSSIYEIIAHYITTSIEMVYYDVEQYTFGRYNISDYVMTFSFLEE